MKKILILPALMIVMAGTVSAQSAVAVVKHDKKFLSQEEKDIRKEKQTDRQELRNLRSEEVSNATRQQFYQDYGIRTQAMWKKDGNFDVATFALNGATISAYYNPNSELVGTTTNKTWADLPARTKQQIAKKYPGYSEVAVTLFNDNEANKSDMILYGERITDPNNYFIEMVKNGKKIVLKSDKAGDVSLFRNL